jgi:predicted molibdopterin-dependent oxidoreductase YjgC
VFRAMEHGTLKGLFVIGENPAQSEADQHHTVKLIEGLEHLVVQEIFLTATAQLADVVLPAASSWCEAEGTVTNSERRIQRVRKALDPPGEARDELWIIAQIAKRLGHDWGTPTAEEMWDECRAVAPAMFGGMSYARLEELGGIQWPCPDESNPGSQFLHGRLWNDPAASPGIGEPAPFSVVEHELPIERPDAEYPFVLTTGRRLDAYNTGVQTAGYVSPLRRAETLDLSPEDARSLGIVEGTPVRVASRRGNLVAPAHIDESLRAGLVFMTPHNRGGIGVNVLTIDEVDPKSGTAEFKACAVSVEPVTQVTPVARTDRARSDVAADD